MQQTFLLVAKTLVLETIKLKARGGPTQDDTRYDDRGAASVDDDGQLGLQGLGSIGNTRGRN